MLTTAMHCDGDQERMGYADFPMISLFESNASRLSDNQRRYLTLPIIADAIDMNLSDPGLLGAVEALVNAGKIERRAHFVDAQDNVHDFDAATYEEAIRQGKFSHPDTGEVIEGVDFLAPYWAVPSAAS